MPQSDRRRFGPTPEEEARIAAQKKQFDTPQTTLPVEPVQPRSTLQKGLDGVLAAINDTVESAWQNIVDPVLRVASAPQSALAGALGDQDPMAGAAKGAIDALAGKPKSVSGTLRELGVTKPLGVDVQVADSVSGETLRDLATDVFSDPLNALDLPLKGAAVAAAALPPAGTLRKLGKAALKQPELFPELVETGAEVAAKTAREAKLLEQLPPTGALPGQGGGAPPSLISNYHSPLPKYIAEQFATGKSGADWYAQALPKIRQMLGDDAEKIIDYFAATSPNATVAANTKFAVRALEQDKAGEKFSRTMGQNIKRLDAAKAGEEFGGRKVRNFAKALRGDPDAVVVDRWVARHWGLATDPLKSSIGDREYQEIEDQIRKHAKDLGIEPRQLQAALWTSAKKNWGRAGDTAEPFEEVLQEMIAQRPLFNPEGLTREMAAPGLAPVEDLFTGPKLQKYAKEIAALHKAGGGSTYALRHGDLADTEAFSVAAFPERELVLPPGSTLRPKDVAAFIQKNQDLLKDMRTSVGSWLVDAESASDRYPAGSIALNVNATPKTLGAARKLASSLGEEQIFDLKRFKTLPTWAKKPEQLPELSSRLNDVEDLEPKAIGLEHRSDTSDLGELDPERVSIQPWSAEYRRSQNYKGKFVPRSFFTRKGGAVEKQILKRPHLYEGEVLDSRLYDVGADPEGFVNLARDRAGEAWGDRSDPAMRTMWERMIQDAGYSGFYNSKNPMKEMADTVVVFDKLPVRAKPGNAALQAGAEQFIKTEGLPEGEFAERVGKLNPKNMRKVAKAYEALEHKPLDPAVQKSYGAMRKEVRKQFDFIQKELGIKLEPWTAEGQPYADSKEMMADVAKNKRLYFFQGGDMPADHPMAEIDPETGLSFNDMFRAVHDVFGHAKEGVGFGPVGEENAFRTHARMFSADARGAMASETKGQNSWVNFGPKGKTNQKNPKKTIYAEQKAALLPEELHKLSAILGPAATAALLERLNDRSSSD